MALNKKSSMDFSLGGKATKRIDEQNPIFFGCVVQGSIKLNSALFGLVHP